MLSIEIETEIEKNRQYAKQIGIYYKLLKKSDELDDKGCDWFCDKCGVLMNYQKNFTTSSDTWICTNCDEKNDVSYNNIIKK